MMSVPIGSKLASGAEEWGRSTALRICGSSAQSLSKRIHQERSDDPAARERFLNEARLAARLNHSALVHVHDILEVDGSIWIVMELVEGQSLARFLDAGPLTALRVAELAIEIAAGLGAAHESGVVLRDLKTENVVVTQDGHAKILDFGLAKLNRTALTESHEAQVVGTPRAMSPEQALGREVDERSDLFSFGVLLYECLCGVSPFLGADVSETLARICNRRQEPIHDHAPDVPIELVLLVESLLEKAPEARPQSAEEVGTELQRITDILLARELETEAEETRDAQTSAVIPVQEPRPALQLNGERRQMSVLFCELVGTRDTEHLLQLTPTFQDLVQRVIAFFGGHVGESLGHRMVIYFGYPSIQENTARNCTAAGLEILAPGHFRSTKGRMRRYVSALIPDRP